MARLYTAVYFSGDRQQYRHSIITVVADDAQEARRKISFQLGTVGRYCFYEDWAQGGFQLTVRDLEVSNE